MTFRQQLDRWLLGIPRAVIEGGATAVTAALSIATANSIGLPMNQLSLNQLGAVWLGGAAWSLNKYLTANPLPTPQPPDTTSTTSTEVKT